MEVMEVVGGRGGRWEAAQSALARCNGYEMGFHVASRVFTCRVVHFSQIDQPGGYKVQE